MIILSSSLIYPIMNLLAHPIVYGLGVSLVSTIVSFGLIRVFKPPYSSSPPIGPQISFFEALFKLAGFELLTTTGLTLLTYQFWSPWGLASMGAIKALTYFLLFTI